MNIRPIVDTINKASSLLIIAGGEPTVDTLGSALALSLGLQSIGKRAQVVSLHPILAQHGRLVGCDKVEQQIASERTFVISLPDAVDSIEKISCYAQEKTLNIVLQPYADVKNFDTKNMQITSTQGGFDAIIYVNVANNQEADHLFGDKMQQMAQLPSIALGQVGDRRIQNALVDPQTPATAILIMQVVQELRTPLSADIANNLLQAIYEATDDFHSPTVSPDIFMAAGQLLQVVRGEAGSNYQPMAPESRQAQPGIAQKMPLTQNTPKMPQRPMVPQPQARQQNFNQPGSPTVPRPMANQFNAQTPSAKPNFGPPNQPYQPRPNGVTTQTQSMPPSQRLNPTGNQIGTQQEFEVDPFFEFDAPPDQYFDEVLTQKPLAQPGRESFASQTNPRLDVGRVQQSRPGSRPQGNPAQGQQKPQEKDWLKQPKVFSGKGSESF